MKSALNNIHDILINEKVLEVNQDYSIEWFTRSNVVIE